MHRISPSTRHWHRVDSKNISPGGLGRSCGAGFRVDSMRDRGGCPGYHSGRVQSGWAAWGQHLKKPTRYRFLNWFKFLPAIKRSYFE